MNTEIELLITCDATRAHVGLGKQFYNATFLKFMRHMRIMYGKLSPVISNHYKKTNSVVNLCYVIDCVLKKDNTYILNGIQNDHDQTCPVLYSGPIFDEPQVYRNYANC